jgi:hypothetical protein
MEEVRLGVRPTVVSLPKAQNWVWSQVMLEFRWFSKLRPYWVEKSPFTPWKNDTTVLLFYCAEEAGSPSLVPPGSAHAMVSKAVGSCECAENPVPE